MPSSRPHAIPTVLGLVQQLRPQSILDIGVGFGKWGHLFREYTDIVAAEHDSDRYEKRHWKVRIDGIEGHGRYITDMHRYIYDELFIGNAFDLVASAGRYDLIFLGDVIEHLERERAERLLGDCLEHANKAVLVSTPRFEIHQGAVCDNEYERHRSYWTRNDFLSWPNAQAAEVDGDVLLAVIRKPGIPKLELASPRAPGRITTAARNAAIALLGERRFEQLRGRSAVKKSPTHC